MSATLRMSTPANDPLADRIVAEGSFVAQHRIARSVGQRTAFDPGIGRLNQVGILAQEVPGKKKEREEKADGIHGFNAGKAEGGNAALRERFSARRGAKSTAQGPPKGTDVRPSRCAKRPSGNQVPTMTAVSVLVPSDHGAVEYEPSLCVIAQGAKEVLLADETYP